MTTTEPGSVRVCDRDAHVIANELICRQHSAIELALPDFPDSEPGQFVQVQCRESYSETAHSLDWKSGGFPSLTRAELGEGTAYLRRPFSIGDHWRGADGAAHIKIVSRNVGTGTDWLEQLEAGQSVNLTGPLGSGFKLPPPDVPVVLVGGGVGIPPLDYLARKLGQCGHEDVTAIFGAMTRDLLPVRLTGDPDRGGRPSVCAELAGNAAYSTSITSDDGSVGMRGFVTDALRAWQSTYRKSRGGKALVCACGPEPMLKAVAEITREFDLDCQLCIERKMGCGLGTCLSCVVKVRDENSDPGWRWALSCSDGPVFDRDELIDDSASNLETS